jgi:hypothetical protein
VEQQCTFKGCQASLQGIADVIRQPGSARCHRCHNLVFPEQLCGKWALHTAGEQQQRQQQPVVSVPSTGPSVKRNHPPRRLQDHLQCKIQHCQQLYDAAPQIHVDLLMLTTNASTCITMPRCMVTFSPIRAASQPPTKLVITPNNS